MDDQPKPAARRSAAAKPGTTATAQAKPAAEKTTVSATKPARAEATKRSSASKTTAAATKAAPKRATAATGAASTVDAPKTPKAPRATPVPVPADPAPPPQTEVGKAAARERDPRRIDAVARLGPDARDWVSRTRERYPAASPAALARLAASAKRGPEWLVLAIAAAYGVDPTDPARATDLADLGIHSGRSGLESRARARYSQETMPCSSV
jgi:hypothetical protein